MRARHARINELTIDEKERLFYRDASSSSHEMGRHIRSW
jgi:nuclear transport factor 2 (NTF2) superfamily protein